MKLISPDNLAEAVTALENGQTVVFPTETSYGLGCDAANQDAVNQIFQIKGRKSDKPLLVVVPNIDMAKKYLVWNELLEDLASKFWPGALTVVGEWNKKANLAVGVVAPDNTVAVRVTSHPMLKFLSTELGRPVVATSANLADAGGVYDPKQVLAMFSEKTAKPGIIVDAGELPPNPPTTIVSVIDNNLKIIRQGQIKIT